jgi:hypothetical protein
MKKIFLIIILVSVSTVSTLFAQTKLFALEYTVGFTSGDFHNFITKPSYRGMTFDFRSLVKDNLGVGVEIGWNTFYQKFDYSTYTEGTVSLTGTQYRYTFATPMLVSIDYYLKPGSTINPFIGFGIGTEYTRNAMQMGLYSLYRDVWHFALKPELGIIYTPASSGVGVILTGKYYNAFKSGDVKTRSYFTANIGLLWEY